MLAARVLAVLTHIGAAELVGCTSFRPLHQSLVEITHVSQNLIFG